MSPISKSTKPSISVISCLVAICIAVGILLSIAWLAGSRIKERAAPDFQELPFSSDFFATNPA